MLDSVEVSSRFKPSGLSQPKSLTVDSKWNVVIMSRDDNHNRKNKRTGASYSHCYLAEYRDAPHARHDSPTFCSDNKVIY